MSNALMAEFADLANEKADLDSRIQNIKKRMKELQDPIREFMLQSGMQSGRFNGRSVHLRETLSFKPKEGLTKGNVIGALVDSGMGEYIKEDYSYMKVLAVIREMDGGVPPPLEAVIDVNTTIEVRSTRGG